MNPDNDKMTLGWRVRHSDKVVASGWYLHLYPGHPSFAHYAEGRGELFKSRGAARDASNSMLGLGVLVRIVRRRKAPPKQYAVQWSDGYDTYFLSKRGRWTLCWSDRVEIYDCSAAAQRVVNVLPHEGVTIGVVEAIR